MNRYESDKKINRVVMTGLMMCLILVATSLFKVPVPFTQGYVHLGDAMIFLSVWSLARETAPLRQVLVLLWEISWAATRCGHHGHLPLNLSWD